MQNLPNLPALVSVTELLLRLEFGFAECVLWIPNDFTHRFEVFGHIAFTPFADVGSEISAIPQALDRLEKHWHVVFTTYNNMTFMGFLHSKKPGLR